MSTFWYGPHMGTVRWLSETERDAWRNLSLMNLQLVALLGREMATDGLSLPDYHVLAELADQSDGVVRVTELGRRLGWEKSRISHHISHMETRGLIRRSKCPTDARGWLVEATDAGRRANEAAAVGHVAAVRRHFVDLLSAEQLAMVDEIARTVLEHLPTDD